MTGDKPYKDGGAFTGDKYWPIAEAKIPILDWGFLRSDANQDTVSVWNGMFFRLEDHLDRFLKNNKKLRFSISQNRQTIRLIYLSWFVDVGSRMPMCKCWSPGEDRRLAAGTYGCVKTVSMPSACPTSGWHRKKSEIAG